MAEESYRELDIKSSSDKIGTGELSWSEKTLVRYVDFFKAVFVFSLLGLIIEVLM